jgi:hypothetical protein
MEILMQQIESQKRKFSSEEKTENSNSLEKKDKD